MILNDGIHLYHGSYTIVKEPDLSKCRKEKDFGQGFYLTTDLNQARTFVKSSIKKAQKEGIQLADSSIGYVSEFVFHKPTEGCDVKIHEFPSANKDWLQCIVSHRKPERLPNVRARWYDYDILAGKVANDNTNPTILAYMSELYGPIESDEAVNIAIGILLPYRLKDQICFRTQKALDTLEFTGYEAVEWQKI